MNVCWKAFKENSETTGTVTKTNKKFNHLFVMNAEQLILDGSMSTPWVQSILKVRFSFIKKLKEKVSFFLVVLVAFTVKIYYIYLSQRLTQH